MSQHDDKLYLIHIRECIARIEHYVADGKDYFLRDIKTQDAVLRNLQVLVESPQRISDELTARYLDVDWREIRAFRNVLVHNYLGIDLDRIWDVVSRDIPDLDKKMQRIWEDMAGQV